MSLRISLALQLFSTAALAQTVFFRQEGVPLETYQASLRSSLGKVTPTDLLEKRLQNDELPSLLQKEVEETLTQVSLHPADAPALFETLVQDLEREPRSQAIRETLQMVFERLGQVSAGPQKLEIEKRRESISPESPDSFLKKPSFLSAEINQKLKSLRARPGGEDAELFWNGQRWSDSLVPTSGPDTQWILVSSSWQPKLVRGDWEKASVSFDQKAAVWVSGTCQNPEYHDLLQTGNHQALFKDQCATGPDDLSTDNQPLMSSSNHITEPNYTKPLLWAAGITAVGLVLLSLSSKKLQIQK